MLRDAIERACDVADDLTERAERLAALVDDLVEETEFGFLFNRERQLFSIGFSVADGRLDPSHYDTLASEARLASFVAIATGSDSSRTLVQARTIADAHGDVARLAVVERVDVRVPDAAAGDARVPQYAPRRDLRGGRQSANEVRRAAAGCHGASPNPPITSRISTATISTAHSAYPDLGLKRGLADDLVIAPYATCSRRWCRQADAVANLKALRRRRPDRTPTATTKRSTTPTERLPKGQRGGVVLPTYMAHHRA